MKPKTTQALTNEYTVQLLHSFDSAMLIPLVGQFAANLVMQTGLSFHIQEEKQKGTKVKL